MAAQGAKRRGRVFRPRIGLTLFAVGFPLALFCLTGELVLRVVYRDGMSFGNHGGAIVRRFERDFNLNRYAYTNLLAAECHAMRDMMNGLSGHSYGFEFTPHVVTHKAKDGEPEWYEVYTG